MSTPDVGSTHRLTVGERVDHGWLLGEHEILLPDAYAPKDLEVGQELEVFVSADREGMPYATTEQPLLQYGEFAFLEVVDIAPHGAYLGWGLGMDLFLPKPLQFERVRVGQKVMVTLCLDRIGRVFASNRLVDHLDDDPSALAVGQPVALQVFGRNDRGWLVIVEGRYAGLLYADQVHRPVQSGLELSGYVQALREDGKIDVCLQRRGAAALTDARQMLVAQLASNDGFLPLTDGSSPEAIRKLVGLSKKAFKKAVGGLYKDALIDLEPGGIRSRS